MSNCVIVTILVVCLLSFILNFFSTNSEHYSQAALTQLVAKGPMDTYLTGDAWKYLYPYYYGHYSYSPHYSSYYPWNIPARSGRGRYGRGRYGRGRYGRGWYW